MTRSSSVDLPPEALLRTTTEHEAEESIATIFDASPDATAEKLRSFPRYIRRQEMTRFLACYEIFQRVLSVKGSIVDCGVNRGFSLMSWGNLSAVLEPNNLMRKVYGFDTFSGFPTVSAKDENQTRSPQTGDLERSTYTELTELIAAHDKNRFLGHVPKVHLIAGDATTSIPRFVEDNPHVLVSLLFLDFDLYEPTRVALETFLPRMPKGAVLAFDELDNPIWPGETAAMLEIAGAGNLRIERLPFDPYMGFAVLT